MSNSTIFTIQFYKTSADPKNTKNDGLELTEDTLVAVTVGCGEKLNIEHMIKHGNSTMR